VDVKNVLAYYTVVKVAVVKSIIAKTPEFQVNIKITKQLSSEYNQILFKKILSLNPS
jgi:hypothetical protein